MRVRGSYLMGSWVVFDLRLVTGAGVPRQAAALPIIDRASRSWGDAEHLVVRALRLVGVAVLAEDMESDKCHLSGIIVRDLAAKVSNYRASQTLDEYLKAQVRQRKPATLAFCSHHPYNI